MDSAIISWKAYFYSLGTYNASIATLCTASPKSFSGSLPSKNSYT